MFVYLCVSRAVGYVRIYKHYRRVRVPLMGVVYLCRVFARAYNLRDVVCACVRVCARAYVPPCVGHRGDAKGIPQLLRRSTKSYLLEKKSEKRRCCGM